MPTKAHTPSNLLSSDIYKSRINILEIMASQHFLTADYGDFTINEVNSMNHNNQLDMLLEQPQLEEGNVEQKGDDLDNPIPTKKVYIKYNLEGKITETIILNTIEDLFYLSETLTKKDTLFIITKDDLNEPMKNVIKHIWEKEKISVVIESITRLQFNILNHSLVPKHEIINQDEIKTMMEKYNVISLDNLPEISRFDPVAKLILIKPNEICRITRPSKSAINSIYYRVCV